MSELHIYLSISVTIHLQSCFKPLSLLLFSYGGLRKALLFITSCLLCRWLYLCSFVPLLQPLYRAKWSSPSHFSYLEHEKIVGSQVWLPHPFFECVGVSVASLLTLSFIFLSFETETGLCWLVSFYQHASLSYAFSRRIFVESVNLAMWKIELLSKAWQVQKRETRFSCLFRINSIVGKTSHEFAEFLNDEWKYHRGASCLAVLPREPALCVASK